MDQTPNLVEEKKVEEYYVFIREMKNSPWLQNSHHATVEDACAAADAVLESLNSSLTPEDVKLVDIFVCRSEDGKFPVPFFNWNESE